MASAASDEFADFAPVSSTPTDEFTGFASADAPKQTIGGAGQAVASGLNAGSADLLGLPVDTARNVLELGKAGAGFVWHEATGRDIPEALQPSESPDVGSSEWIKEKLRHVEGRGAVDVQQPTKVNKYLHAGSEVIPSALTGAEGGTVGAVRAASAGAATGAAQQGAADLGLDPVSQAAVGVLAGYSASHAAAPRAVAPSNPAPRPIKSAAFEATPAAPGEAPRLNIGGASTAADAAKQGATIPTIDTPSESSPPVAVADHSTRAQTLRDIGLDEARESAIRGDTKEAGTDFQTSKLDGPAGNRMSDVIGKERSVLQNYVGRIADDTGGSRGMDQADLYNRGSIITKPIDELANHFDSKIKEAYTAADAKAGGQPVGLDSTDALLKDSRADFLGTVEGKQLREGLQARMRDLGLMDGDGNAQQATVQQAERLKQYLGDQWSPRTGRLISKIKDAIDDDVTKAAGSDVYANARQTRALRATLLDDPTGIAKLASPDDRLGINRAIPHEKVPDYIANLPADQFGHIVNTLRDVPAEVQPAASAALNEIRAHFANSVEKAGNSTQGMWNTKGANDFLSKNQMRMAHVFSPEEMGRFKTLADAGSILRMDRTYPGAAAQGHNLAMRGVLGAIEHGSAAVGAHAGGLVGYGIGRVLGKGAEKVSNSVLRSKVESRIRNLSSGDAGPVPRMSNVTASGSVKAPPLTQPAVTTNPAQTVFRPAAGDIPPTGAATLPDTDTAPQNMSLSPDERALVREGVAARRRAEDTSPAESMKAEFDKTNPEEAPAGYLGKRVGKSTAELHANPDDPNTVHLEKLAADQPGGGHGTAALRQITDLADKHGARVTLDAIPQGKDPVPKARLMDFYKRHGFKPNGDTKSSMTREPRIKDKK